QGETQETQQRSGAKGWILPLGRTQTLHRPKISNQAGCGMYRVRRFLPGPSRYACDWNFVSACFPSTDGDVAVNLVGRFRNLSTRRFYRGEATIENLARHRHSRAGLGTSTRVTQSSR